MANCENCNFETYVQALGCPKVSDTPEGQKPDCRKAYWWETFKSPNSL